MLCSDVNVFGLSSQQLQRIETAEKDNSMKGGLEMRKSCRREEWRFNNTRRRGKLE
jgi:hypothetical protein